MFDRITPIVKNLLIINGLFFIATVAFGMKGIELSDFLGLHSFRSLGFQPFQMVSYMFMHASFTHLLFNMFALFIFGSALERVWDAKRFLIYYMATGVGAGLIQMLVAHIRVNSMFAEIPQEGIDLILTEGYGLLQEGKNYADILMGSANISLNIPTVGASGAVFGILLAFGMLFPNTELMLLFPPIPIKAKYFVIGYGAIELWMAFSNSPGDNVAHFAHLGGMLIGYILIKKWQRDRQNFY